MSSLTGKQQRFIDEYLKCWNATEAARLAGYGGDDNALGVIGFKNLRNAKISERICNRLGMYAMSANEALARLGAEARASIGDYIDEFGNFQWEKIKENGHLFKSITHTKGKQSSIVMYDGQAALVHILKEQGAFTQKVDVTTQGDKVTIPTFTEIIVKIPEQKEGD